MDATASAFTQDDDRPLAERLRQPRAPAERLRDAQAALMALYQRHAPGLLAFLACRVPAADLDDVHQAVWQNVWQHAPHAFDGRHFRAWIYKIARNLLIDRSRRRKPDPADDLDGKVDPRAGPSVEVLMDHERRAALERCLEKLAETARALVRGRMGGDSYEDLCGRLGLDANKAYKTYHAAVKQLRDCVQEAGV